MFSVLGAAVPGGSLFEKYGFKSLPTVLWAIASANRREGIATVGWRWPVREETRWTGCSVSGLSSLRDN